MYIPINNNNNKNKGDTETISYIVFQCTPLPLYHGNILMSSDNVSYKISRMHIRIILIKHSLETMLIVQKPT